MELQVDIQKEDFIAFNMFHFRTRKLKRFLFFSISISVALPFLLTKQEHTVSDFIFSFLLFNILFFALLFINIFLSKYIPLQKTMPIGVRTYIFRESEIVCKTNETYTALQWIDIQSIERGKKAIYLFVNENAAYIIPYHAFLGNNEILAFHDTISLLHANALQQNNNKNVT